MLIKPATAAALGIDLGLGSNISDGTVLLNTTALTSGSYSLLSVTEHEIDSILGLGSTLGLTLQGNESSMPSPEDLYRYDASGNRSFTTSPSALAYFSVDGQNLLFQFNNTGHGDYGASLPSGGMVNVQDAYVTPGTSPVLGVNEISALNAIGFTLASPVPEPHTWALLFIGLALIGCRIGSWPTSSAPPTSATPSPSSANTKN
jgi:hypothetical protein